MYDAQDGGKAAVELSSGLQVTRADGGSGGGEVGVREVGVVDGGVSVDSVTAESASAESVSAEGHEARFTVAEAGEYSLEVWLEFYNSTGDAPQSVPAHRAMLHTRASHINTAQKWIEFLFSSPSRVPNDAFAHQLACAHRLARTGLRARLWRARRTPTRPRNPAAPETPQVWSGAAATASRAAARGRGARSTRGR